MPSENTESGTAAAAPARHAPHLAALDALRGLAIILVVIGHYLPGHVVGGTVAEILDPCALGGVTLFFLLSGFLIARNLAHGHSTTGYALRRIFRILPAYWVSLVVFIVLHRLWLDQADFGHPIDTLFNALLLQDVAKAPLLNAAFWTLLVEAKFYILAPLLVLGGRRVIQIAPYVTMALNGVIMARRGEASNLLTYLAFCFVGMNFELWCRKELSDRALTALAVSAAVAAGIYSPYVKIGLVVFGLINAGLMALALRHGPRLKLPMLSFIGAVSYSWYLYHGGIGYPLMAALEASRWAIAPLMSACIGVVVTLLVAWLSYRLIEKPGISLGRMLEKRSTNENLHAMPERS
jgi:peptidoglycan/LPS O-acetylase OafA/YrhL